MGEQNCKHRVKSGKAASTAVRILTIASLICLIMFILLSAFNIANYYARVFEYYSTYLLEHGVPGFLTDFQWLICGLLLPVSLMLLNNRPKRRAFSVILLVATVVALIIQSLSTILSMDELWSVLDLEHGSLICRLANIIPGSRLFLMRHIAYDSISWESTVRYIATSLGSLCYILSNLLCAIGFLVLAVSKQPKNAEVPEKLPKEVMQS